MDEQGRRGAPPAVAAGLAATVTLILVTRLLRHPVDDYGVGGTGYNEHWQRLVWSDRVSGSLADPSGGLAGLVQAMDVDFPPGLYAWGEAASLLVGRSAGGVALAGIGWLLLLAVAVGLVGEALGGRRAGIAAFVGTLLLPAAHGSAIRFYFDLPMTALAWCAVAMLAAMGARRPLIGGLLVGVLALAATAFKWTAIPLAAPLLLGMALERGSGPGGSGGAVARPVRRRLVALAIAAALWGGGTAAWVATSGPQGSLQRMASEAQMAGPEADGGPRAVGLGGVASGVSKTLVEPAWERRVPARVAWYGLASIGAVVSPALTVVALLLLLPWLGGRRSGARLAAIGLLGTAAFLLLLVRPIDERFVLTLAPALPLLAGLGWASLPEGRRRRWGAMAVAVGLVVALDFHHLPSTPVSRAAEAQPWQREIEPDEDNVLSTVRFRGLGAASSWERRGWGRLDEAPPDRRPLRRALLDVLVPCAPSRIEQQEYAPVITEQGDLVWLAYEFALRQARGELPRTPFWGTCDPSQDTPPGLVVLAAELPGGVAPPSGCATSPPLRRWRRVDDPDGQTGVALFTPGGASPCTTGGGR